nr:Gfo/Idh/MocA family oxidoreductase [Marinicella sp. W31]MDC2875910.1 Gfo/Idh/MocA family oxidoreductase [Marinicella sp. W31]
MAFTHAWHQAIIEDFAEAIEDGRPPVVSGRAALDVHALIAALTRSSQEGQAVTL